MHINRQRLLIAGGSCLLAFTLLSANTSGAIAKSDESKQTGKATDTEAAPVDRPIRDKWALVVGISKFADPTHNLEYPAKDAQDFASYLVREAGFAPDHVKLLLDSAATEKAILSELGNKWLPRVANPDDLVVIFISSHGSGAELDVGGQNYLVAYDTDLNDLYTTGIPMNRLAEDIKDRVHCDRVVIFLDACHSGATTLGAKGLIRTGVNADEFAVGSGQMVITSSTENQVSWESKTKENSVFTAALLDALRSKGDKTSLGDMFAVLKDRVQDTVLRERGVLQTPVLKSAWRGQEIVLAAKPANPQPGFPAGSPTFDQLSASTKESAKTSEPPKPPAPALITSRSIPPPTSALANPKSRATTTVLKAEPATPRPAQPLSSSPALSQSSSASVDTHRESDPSIAVVRTVKPSALLVPGTSIGRTSLGTNKEDVVKKLGKPGEIQDNSYIYRTSDRKYFLCIHFNGDYITELAFSSPVFSTADRINLATFEKHLSDFQSPRQAFDKRFDIYTLKGGGFSILAPRDGTYGITPIGIIHAKTQAPTRVDWLPGVTNTSNALPPPSNTLVPSKNSPTPAPASNSTTLIVPGSLLGKTRLNMSRADLLRRLGKPTEDRGDVLNYWSGNRKLFVSFRFRAGLLTDIAFCSPDFATKDGISVSNYARRLADSFRRPTQEGEWDIFTLEEGGFSIATKKGRTVGWLHSTGARPSGVFWPQQ